MKRATIVFTAPGVAELQEAPVPVIGEKSVLVKTDFTVISAGTERANLLGMQNTSGDIRNDSCLPRFPRTLGYCGVGHVLDVGKAVSETKTGDRVIVYFGIHSSYNLVPEENVIRIDDDNIESLDAAPAVLAQISLGGVRMAGLGLGESVLVMGLGILGLYAVELCRLNGAYPVIAADPLPERRAKALEQGADFALDPYDADFAQKVVSITNGIGVQAVIEVSGAAAALEQSLECTARMGRIVLLGCTRVNDKAIDFYHMVHYKGVRILGAHTFVRPNQDSYRDYWTYRDDCVAILNFISGNRMHPKELISEVHSPGKAPEVYARLAYGKDFPVGVAFDWRGME